MPSSPLAIVAGTSLATATSTEEKESPQEKNRRGDELLQAYSAVYPHGTGLPSATDLKYTKFVRRSETTAMLIIMDPIDPGLHRGVCFLQATQPAHMEEVQRLAHAYGRDFAATGLQDIAEELVLSILEKLPETREGVRGVFLSCRAMNDRFKYDPTLQQKRKAAGLNDRLQNLLTHPDIGRVEDFLETAYTEIVDEALRDGPQPHSPKLAGEHLAGLLRHLFSFDPDQGNENSLYNNLIRSGSSKLICAITDGTIRIIKELPRSLQLEMIGVHDIWLGIKHLHMEFTNYRFSTFQCLTGLIKGSAPQELELIKEGDVQKLEAQAIAVASIYVGLVRGFSDIQMYEVVKALVDATKALKDSAAKVIAANKLKYFVWENVHEGYCNAANISNNAAMKYFKELGNGLKEIFLDCEVTMPKTEPGLAGRMPWDD